MQSMVNAVQSAVNNPNTVAVMNEIENNKNELYTLGKILDMLRDLPTSFVEENGSFFIDKEGKVNISLFIDDNGDIISDINVLREKITLS